MASALAFSGGLLLFGSKTSYKTTRLIQCERARDSEDSLWKEKESSKSLFRVSLIEWRASRTGRALQDADLWGSLLAGLSVTEFSKCIR